MANSSHDPNGTNRPPHGDPAPRNTPGVEPRPGDADTSSESTPAAGTPDIRSGDSAANAGSRLQPSLQPADAGSGPDPRPVLRIGHSPDPDDAFMWFPITGIDGGPPLIDTGRFRYQAVMRDIETLNRHAERSTVPPLDAGANGSTPTTMTTSASDTPGTGNPTAGESPPDPAHGKHTPLPATPQEAEPLPDEALEITAISIGQYPFVANRYALTSCGASLGLGYGPRIVAPADAGITLDRIANDADLRLAIPGERTSAYLALRLLVGRPKGHVEVVPFDLIPEQVEQGKFDAGLIIHEGQLTFEQHGLALIADMGVLFKERFDLPLPLGGNAIRRDLEARYGTGALKEITATLRRSILYAMEHRDEALDFALRHARGMTRDLADEFVAMYVNRHTLEYGDTGETAVKRFLAEAEQAGLAPAPQDGVRIVTPTA